MKRRAVLLAILVLGLVVGAAQANVSSGTINAGRNGQGFADDFASAWNDSSEFICTSTSPFKVMAASGHCAGHWVTIEFDVNSGGTSNESHTFDYEIDCAGGWSDIHLSHSLGFDGGQAVNINGPTVVFTLGSDTVTPTTGSGGGPQVPALGRGGVVVVAGLLGIGILIMMRRRQPPGWSPPMITGS